MGLATPLLKSALFFDRHVSYATWQDQAKKSKEKIDATHGSAVPVMAQMKADLWAPATAVLQGLRWTQPALASTPKTPATAPHKAVSILSPFIFAASAAGLVVRFIIAAAATVIVGAPWAVLRQVAGLVLAAAALGCAVLLKESDDLPAEKPSATGDSAIEVDQKKLGQMLKEMASSWQSDPSKIVNCVKVDYKKLLRALFHATNKTDFLADQINITVAKIYKPMRDEAFAAGVDAACKANDTTVHGYVVGLVSASLLKAMLGCGVEDTGQQPGTLTTWMLAAKEKALRYADAAGVDLSHRGAVGGSATVAAAMWSFGQGLSSSAPFVATYVGLERSFEDFMKAYAAQSRDSVKNPSSASAEQTMPGAFPMAS